MSAFAQRSRLSREQAGGAEDQLGPSFPVGVMGAALPEDDEDDEAAVLGGVADIPSHYSVGVATR